MPQKDSTSDDADYRWLDWIELSWERYYPNGRRHSSPLTESRRKTVPIDAEIVKRPLRTLRAWPPLNHVVTSTCRASMNRLGRDPGLLARYLPRAGLVEATLPDGRLLRLWSRADDDVTPQVYWKGWAGHETETSRLFFDCARSARTTVDIGAHIGYFALLAAHANPNGYVYAFEPHPMVYERLARNGVLNGLANLSCQQTAVGRRKGKAQFFHGKQISSSSSLSQEFMESIVDPSRLISSQVDVISLDEFVEFNAVHDVDLIKVDTETTEDAVFQGMARLLERDKPVIFCEILKQTTGEAIEQILSSVGYRYFLLTQGGAMKCEHVRPDPLWRNHCFVPDSRPVPWEVQ